jgi:SAM-dependent methyltransferase
MSATSELDPIKARMKATWMAGDYATFCTYMEPGAIDLLADWKVTPGQRFLDVACGAGQLAIPAARQGLEVTGIDIAPNLVQAARRRAAEDMLDAVFDEGDAEEMPYRDGSFDVVGSLFGAMFAPRPGRAAAELMRVCRPGGRILLGNWLPRSFVGDMFRTIARHLPPPAGVPSPLLWGDENVVRERFAGASSVHVGERVYSRWSYPFPVEGVVDFFFSHFGPLAAGCERLSEEERQALRDDLVQVFRHYDRGTDGTTLLEGRFLSVEVRP